MRSFVALVILAALAVGCGSVDAGLNPGLTCPDFAHVTGTAVSVSQDAVSASCTAAGVGSDSSDIAITNGNPAEGEVPAGLDPQAEGDGSSCRYTVEIVRSVPGVTSCTLRGSYTVTIPAVAQ